MNKLLALSLLASSCFAQGTQSMIWNGSSQGATVTIPNTSAYNAATAVRIEFRLTNFSLNIATRQRIFSTNTGVLVAILENSNTLNITDFANCGGCGQPVDLTGRTDVMVRYTVPAVGEAMVVELWNSDGSGYASNCVPSGGACDTAPATSDWHGAMTLASDNPGNYYNGKMAYFRMFSSVLPTGFGATPPNNLTAGDLIDWEFEGTCATTAATDSSGNGLTLTLTGTPTCGTTPFFVYLPASYSARSGAAISADASPTAASSYSWSLTSGTCGSLTGTTTNTVSIAAGCTGFQQITLHLSATDAASQTSTADLYVGVVPEVNGVVTVSDPIWDKMLGPMVVGEVTGTTASPWSWVESQRQLLSEYWYSSSTTAPGGAWPATFAAIEENLSYYDSPLALYRQYYRTGLTKYQTWARNWTAYLWALSDGWNSGAPTGGCNSNWVAPRTSVVQGMIAWLYDTSGDLTASGCVQQYVDYEYNNYIETRNTTSGYVGPYLGARESSYAFNAAETLAESFDVNVNSHGLWSTRVADGFNTYWKPYQCTVGNKYAAACGQVNTQMAGTIAVNNTTTITGTGTAFLSALGIGIVRAVVTDGGSGYGSAPTVTGACSGCVLTPNMSGGSVASVTVTTPGTPTSTNPFQSLVFTGGSPSVAAKGWSEAAHIILSDATGGDCASVFSSRWAPYPITAITNNTSATVYMAVNGGDGPSGNTVSGCLGITETQGAADDLYSTRWGDQAWPGFSEQVWHATIGAEGIARYYQRTSDANALTYLQNAATEAVTQEYHNSSCLTVTVRSVYYAQYGSGPIGSGCSTAEDIHSQRSQTNTVIHIYGWLYKFTGNTQWKTYGDNYMSANFGDSGTGPGTDGYYGQFSIPYGSKFYGQSLRSIDSYLANRLGAAAATGGTTFSGAARLSGAAR